MRRVARHLFTILSAISLMLCVAVCVLWVRSYWTADSLGYSWQRPAPANWGLSSNYGGVEYQRLTYPATTLVRFPSVGWGYVHYPPTRDTLSWDWHSFRGVFYSDRTVRAPSSILFGMRQIVVWVPYWLLLVVVVPLPVVQMFLLLRRRAARRAIGRGFCPSCGYDLRASPERCPECGKFNPTAA